MVKFCFPYVHRCESISIYIMEFPIYSIGDYGVNGHGYSRTYRHYTIYFIKYRVLWYYYLEIHRSLYFPPPKNNKSLPCKNSFKLYHLSLNPGTPTFCAENLSWIWTFIKCTRRRKVLSLRKLFQSINQFS